VRITVVLNKSAGTLMGMDADATAARIGEAFRAAGHETNVLTTLGRDVPRVLKQACEADMDAVVVGGGDGTIATAAHHMVGKDMALGILPLGTMNLLAKDLRIPSDLDEAAHGLAHGSIRTIDACDVNGRVYLNNAVLGLYPRMVEERERQRGVHHLRKWPAMGIAAVEVLWRYPQLRVEIEKDGERWSVTTPVLAVANNVYDESFGKFFHRERLDAGVMGVYVAKHRSRLGLTFLMLRTVTGGWQKDQEVEVFTATEITVHSRRRRIRVATDGEVLRLKPPLRFRIRPHALKILAPAGNET